MITGEDYTKWLWGNQHYDGSVYNFTTDPRRRATATTGRAPSSSCSSPPSPPSTSRSTGRIKSRFNQNQWTNFGGFGGRNPALEIRRRPLHRRRLRRVRPALNEYIKLRGLTVTHHAGLQLARLAPPSARPTSACSIRSPSARSATSTATTARPSSSRAPLADRKLGYDLIRISLPRLWAGPNFNTGDYTAQDGAYGPQLKSRAEPDARLRPASSSASATSRSTAPTQHRQRPRSAHALPQRRLRSEARRPPEQHDRLPRRRLLLLDGRVRSDARRAGELRHLRLLAGPRGQAQRSGLQARTSTSTIRSASACRFNIEYFNIGADYVSVMAARRESDVLLTEGHDGTCAFPGPDNSAFGVFAGNPTRIGYGGWQGNAQQVATINVDNEFTDFDEPMAETGDRLEGHHRRARRWTIGNLDLSGEITLHRLQHQLAGLGRLGQADRPARSTRTTSRTPASAPSATPTRRSRTRRPTSRSSRPSTCSTSARASTSSASSSGSTSSDNRMTDARFLPYQPGDCPGGGVACANARRPTTAPATPPRPSTATRRSSPSTASRATSGSRSTA